MECRIRLRRSGRMSTTSQHTAMLLDAGGIVARRMPTPAEKQQKVSVNI